MQAKSKQVASLEAKVYELNNKSQYETSLKNILDFLSSKNISDEDAYYGNLFLSDTYKRIFDYENVLLYLNRANIFAKKITNNKQYYIDNVSCQKAFALFDIQHYDEAKVVMQALAKNNYTNLSAEQQAMIIMQDAYLLYLDKNYKEAEKQYDVAIVKMTQSSPCDLPIIYGKKIALYGAMNNELKMQEAYTIALKYADSCKITKYNLYAAELIRNTYQSMGKYDKAFKYFTTYDSLNTIYNADGFKDKLKELEVKYETEKKEQSIHLKEQIITGNKRLIALLIIAIGTLVLMIALYITIQRRRKLIKEKKQSELFTKQLLNKTEEERKRIASELHDSVNNELLLIRTETLNNPESAASKIDGLINHVRGISRNLHPVMFDEMGLQNSIEQLAYRIQEYNNFVLNTDITYNGGLTKQEELQVFRIIQEATNNIIKYSKAVAALIEITHINNKLHIEIKDNGNGFNVVDVLKNHEAFGLHNIIERCKILKGTVKINSNNSGTTILLDIPIEDAK